MLPTTPTIIHDTKSQPKNRNGILFNGKFRNKGNLNQNSQRNGKNNFRNGRGRGENGVKDPELQSTRIPKWDWPTADDSGGSFGKNRNVYSIVVGMVLGILLDNYLFGNGNGLELEYLGRITI